MINRNIFVPRNTEAVEVRAKAVASQMTQSQLMDIGAFRDRLIARVNEGDHIARAQCAVLDRVLAEEMLSRRKSKKEQIDAIVAQVQSRVL